MSSIDSPSASCRVVAIERFAVDATRSPPTDTEIGTGPVGEQGSAVTDGTRMLSDVVEAAVTVAFTPFTRTSLPATDGEKLVPLIVAAPSGTQVAGPVATIVGALIERTIIGTESVFPSVLART